MRLLEFIRLQLQELDRWRLLYYLGVAAFAFCLESAPEWLNLSPDTQNAWAGPVRVFEKLYQWQATLGPRKPRSHFVRLIVLRPDTEPAELVEKSNRCPQREFFSRLLPAIAAVSPALIVIDKTSSPNLNCPSVEPERVTGATGSGTDHLLLGAAEAAESVPIVVSAATESAREAKTDTEEFRRILERHRAVVKMASLVFPPSIRYGISTLDIDDRKIPLKWPVYPNKASMNNEHPVVCEAETGGRSQHLPPCMEPSLAFMAATLFDPSVETLPTIASFEKHHQFAFTNFLRENEIGSYSAIDLLCNAPGSRTKNWRACKSDPMHNSLMQKLRHRVVVIGEQDTSDFWDSPVGGVPGVVLHANNVLYLHLSIMPVTL